VGTFAEFQPRYAEHGIAAIPLRAIKDVRVKAPCVSGAQRTTLTDSAAYARKFPRAEIGFWSGKRNRITILDIDSKNENDLADAMMRFGQSPFIVRTAAKGGFHAYYRHNNETHGIKPEDGKPWDILANNLVVAPPTACFATGGSYEIIRGSLDDLDDLPVMCDAPKVPDGRRNRDLWQHCMRQAPHCDAFDDLLDVARTFNQNCDPPLQDNEIVKCAKSAWDCTANGLNRFGKHGAWLPVDDVNKLIKQGKRGQDELLLTTFFRANEGPTATFLIANGLAKNFGWTIKRLAAARKRALVNGTIRRVAAPPKGPHRFQWSRVVKTDHLFSKNTTSPNSSVEDVTTEQEEMMIMEKCVDKPCRVQSVSLNQLTATVFAFGSGMSSPANQSQVFPSL
jgi:hypothetical protein